jgi:hypothetical protein
VLPCLKTEQYKNGSETQRGVVALYSQPKVLNLHASHQQCEGCSPCHHDKFLHTQCDCRTPHPRMRIMCVQLVKSRTLGPHMLICENPHPPVEVYQWFLYDMISARE